MSDETDSITVGCYTFWAKISKMESITLGLNVKVNGGISATVTFAATGTLTGSVALNASVGCDVLCSMGALVSWTNEYITNAVEFNLAEDTLASAQSELATVHEKTAVVMQYVDNEDQFRALEGSSTALTATMTQTEQVHQALLRETTSMIGKVEAKIDEYTELNTNAERLVATVRKLQAQIATLGAGKVEKNAGTSSSSAKVVTSVGNKTF